MGESFSELPKSEARRDFLQIVNKFAKAPLPPIMVTDHGEPQAVLLSFQEFQAMRIKLKNYEKSKIMKKKDKETIWGGAVMLEDMEDSYSIWDELKEDWEEEFDKEL